MRVSYKGMDKDFQFRLAEIYFKEEETETVDKMISLMHEKGWHYFSMFTDYGQHEVEDFEEYREFMKDWKDCKKLLREQKQQAETEPEQETEATAETEEATAEPATEEPEITVTLEWFEQKDFKPIWNARHHKKVHGTPEECMAQIREFKDHHDVVKYTIVNIVDISRRETA